MSVGVLYSYVCQWVYCTHTYASGCTVLIRMSVGVLYSYVCQWVYCTPKFSALNWRCIFVCVQCQELKDGMDRLAEILLCIHDVLGDSDQLVLCGDKVGVCMYVLCVLLELYVLCMRYVCNVIYNVC